MKQKFLFLMLAVIWLLAGCTSGDHSPQAPSCRIVNQITVQFENGPLRATRLYTDPEKMRRVLNYLRLLTPYSQAQDDPDASQGSLFRIILSHTDGCQRTYAQLDDRFISEDNGPWMLINPQKAQELSLILGEMESDA